ncbi:MAG: nucleoside-diphosphate-sugar epimerase [Candidatus Poriferisodalaceae bacterium]|jgi:nucleoside-diphosphate-sugar epimerase
MSRIVITGGAGFLGSHLGERLLSEGHSVVAVDNLITGDLTNVAHLREDPGFEFVQQDISEKFTVEGDVDAVLNMASPASPIDYLELPIETLMVGSYGTHNALELARVKGARFLHASTSEVYGDPEQHPQQEDYWGNVNPVGPRSVYDEAKRFSEALATAYQRTHGVEVRLARIFNTYGPRMRPNDGRVVSTFLLQALRGEPLTVFGDGLQTRSFCFVDDLVSGILGLLWSDHVGPMNIGNPTEMTMLELAKAVGEVTGVEVNLAHRDLPEDDPTRRRPDITLARSVLGWEPQVELVEGLRQTAEWMAGILAASR